MKRPISRVLLLALTVVLLCAFDKTWKLYANKAGKLSVMLPETPKESSQVEKTAVGDITIWQASVIQQSRAYFVSYNDMPKSTWRDDPKKMLEGSRDGAAARVKGKVVADREIKLAGKYPGREFKIVVGQMELNQRVYLVKHRLYQVNIGCLEGTCTSDEIQEYLDSLKVQ